METADSQGIKKKGGKKEIAGLSFAFYGNFRGTVLMARHYASIMNSAG